MATTKKEKKKEPIHLAKFMKKSYTIKMDIEELLQLGFIGCKGCAVATKGSLSHPPNNHFDSGACAHCSCQKFDPLIRYGEEVRMEHPDIEHAAENADMVAIVRELVERAGYTTIPFLDDCVAKALFDLSQMRQALLQVKVDHINKKMKVPLETMGMIEKALRPE